MDPFSGYVVPKNLVYMGGEQFLKRRSQDVFSMVSYFSAFVVENWKNNNKRKFSLFHFYIVANIIYVVITISIIIIIELSFVLIYFIFLFFFFQFFPLKKTEKKREKEHKSL